MNTNTAKATATNAAKYSGLIALWAFQYCFAVPCQIFGRVLKGFAKFGFVGFLLLCIPILGWIVLAVMIFRQTPQVEKRSIFQPWGVSHA